MSIWDKFRVETPSLSGLNLNPLSRERDKSEHDTIISRAMLRHYGEDIPGWLEPARAATETSSGIKLPRGQNLSQHAHNLRSNFTQVPSSMSRTSLDFLNRRQPTRDNPITQLTSGVGGSTSNGTTAAPGGYGASVLQASSQSAPGSTPANGAPPGRSRRGLGQKLRGSNW